MTDSRRAEHGGPARAVSAIARTARPTQWIKNVVVFAAPAASGSLVPGHHGAALALTLTVLAFCAAAGGTYAANDLADVDADRRHPRKRRRPIAAGEITGRTARRAAAGFLVVGAVLGLAVNRRVAVVVVAYELLTLAYSRWLKHLALVDVVALAGGFVLRAAAGAAATGTGMRTSFLGAVFFGTMFVAVAKRRSECHELGGEAAAHRPVLAIYSAPVLSALLGASLVGAVASYGVWVMVRPAGEGGPWLDLSLLTLLVGAGRFAALAWRGQAGEPPRLLVHERLLPVAALATFVLAAAGAHAALT